MGRFEGQVVVVTGAGTGLGRAHARLLAAEGASVVVNAPCADTSGGCARRVVAQIRAAGGEAVADTHEASTDGAEVVATALAAFGGLHAVVNSAGADIGEVIDNGSELALDRMMASHVRGTAAVVRAAWPVFRRNGYGRVVNTSSASVFGLAGATAYSTAKCAVLGLTRALAAEGSPLGIKVNAVMPIDLSSMVLELDVLREALELGFSPEGVSPFVGALASRDVPVTGETFIVGGSRAARVVLGTVPGLSNIASVDDALGRFYEAMRSTNIAVHTDAMTAVLDQCARIGLDLSALP